MHVSLEQKLPGVSRKPTEAPSLQEGKKKQRKMGVAGKAQSVAGLLIACPQY